MDKIKIDSDIMRHIALFESLTGAKVKDCFPEQASITYIVEENEAGKAIGRNGINVKRIGNMAKKSIRIIEFSAEMHQFIRNLIHPLKVSDIREEECDGKKIITMLPVDSRTRGYLIGRAAQSLRSYESIVKRYFRIDELRVA